jgi:hypothetical protein
MNNDNTDSNLAGFLQMAYENRLAQGSTDYET